MSHGGGIMSDPTRYDAVAANLPTELPAVTLDQAIKVRDAIIRHFFMPKGLTMSSAWDHSHYGDRVWISKKPTRSDNNGKGLGRIIHDVSHALFERVYGSSRRAHDPLHVRYECDVAAWVAERIPRWFAPPKPVEPKRKLIDSERRSREYQGVVAGLKRWDAKLRRAERAIAKLKRRGRGLKRAMYEHDMRPLVCPKTGTTKKCNDQLCCY